MKGQSLFCKQGVELESLYVHYVYGEACHIGVPLDIIKVVTQCISRKRAAAGKVSHLGGSFSGLGRVFPFIGFAIRNDI